ncbi:MAG: glycosyltransferase family 39 protein [Bacteroidales bacterium]
MITKSQKNYWILTAVFILVKISLHFATSTNYELHRDEMLYFNMADYPAFGYVSVPPFTGWLAWLIKSAFGYSVWFLRLLPALAGAVSMYIISRMVSELGGKVTSLIIAELAYLFSPGFLIVNSIFTPNAFEQLFWLLITYFIFKMILENEPGYWLLIVILSAFSFLTKYSLVIFIAGIAIAFIFSPYRKMFFSKYLYLSVLVGVLIIAPNIIWQYSHNWPVFQHFDELKQTQLVNFKFSHFISEFFGLNLMASIVWIFGLLSLFFFKEMAKYRFIAIGVLLSMLMFVLFRGKAYYLLGLIPVMLAFGGYGMEKYLTRRFNLINKAVVILIFTTGIAALPFCLPVLSFDALNRYSEKTGNLNIFPFYRWEDGKIHPVSQVFADMTGWEEMVQYVSKSYKMLDKEEQKNCTIFAEENYGYAGAVNFYGKKYNLPAAITFLDNYTLWAPGEIPAGTFIYINTRLDDIKDLFENITLTGSVNNKYFRENGLSVYICRNPKGNMTEIYRQLAAQKKQKYSRE